MTGQEYLDNSRPEAVAEDLHDYLASIDDEVAKITDEDINARLAKLLRPTGLTERAKVTEDEAVPSRLELKEDGASSVACEIRDDVDGARAAQADLMSSLLGHLDWCDPDVFIRKRMDGASIIGDTLSRHSAFPEKSMQGGKNELDVRSSVERLSFRLMELKVQVAHERAKVVEARKEAQALRKSIQDFWHITYAEEGKVRQEAFEVADAIQESARRAATACRDQALDELSHAREERRRAETYLREVRYQAGRRDGKVPPGSEAVNLLLQPIVNHYDSGARVVKSTIYASGKTSSHSPLAENSIHESSYIEKLVTNRLGGVFSSPLLGDSSSDLILYSSWREKNLPGFISRSTEKCTSRPLWIAALWHTSASLFDVAPKSVAECQSDDLTTLVANGQVRWNTSLDYRGSQDDPEIISDIDVCAIFVNHTESTLSPLLEVCWPEGSGQYEVLYQSRREQTGPVSNLFCRGGISEEAPM